MKIEISEILYDNSSLITGTTTLAPAVPTDIDRIITLVSGGPFYIKRGIGATSSNFTWMLTEVGQMITVENYHGILTVDTDPANAINVAIGTAKQVPLTLAH